MTQDSHISEDDVQKATGRSWPEWFALLGAAEVAQASREEIIVFLREQHGVPSWWQQAIADAYEQSIGRIPKDGTDDGFQMTLTCAIALPAETVFKAWIDGELRAKWLRHGDFEPGMVRAPDTVHGKWIPNGSRLDVNVAQNGEGACELTLTHRRLESAESVAQMQEFWKRSIDRLVERIGGAR